MKHNVLFFLLSIFSLVTSTGPLSYAQPVWTFRVVVAVEKKTADYYQQTYAKDIKLIVNEQLGRVNANFNKSDKFNGTYNFRVDSIYVFDGPVANEVFRPHPRYDYAIVVDGFFDGSVGGGWWGSYQTIYHAWKWDSFDGPFAQYATDGLTHELGHARGAVDIYGMRVEGSKNPVNGEAFEPVNSIMNYPYGNITWDEYTLNLLNETANGPITGEAWITKPFPASMRLTTVDALGQPLAGVSIEMYPVDWFSYSVSPTSILRYTTTPFGTYVFSTNPFQPATSGYPWTIRYCNFLIKATYNSIVTYKWLPLYDVQNAYFRNGANSVYTAEIQLPVTYTPTQTIKLISVSANHFQIGDEVAVAFTTTGTFESTNQFTLFQVDQNNNAYQIGRAASSGVSTITGKIITTGLKNQYRLRIVSTRPDVKSDDYPISVNTLAVKQPLYNCETGAITFRVEGGDSTAITFSAPGITRSQSGDYTGFVEQELRRDPQVIPITATQSGFSVTYNFNLKAFCAFTILPPILREPALADMRLQVGQSGPFKVYISPFFDPTPINNPDHPYYPVWNLQIDGLPANLYVLGKVSEGSATPFFLLQGTPIMPGTYPVTITGSTAAFPDRPIKTSFTIRVVYGSYTQLTLQQPRYDCQTGAITFLADGGDGSPITYTAPGIARASLTSNTGTVEQGLRNDPKSLTITAMQSGQTASTIFDFGAYCAGTQPPPTDGPLKLLAPTYDCATGAIRFNTSGGNGTLIEYQAAPGITGWTSNPNQFVDQESRTAADVKPFILMARQSGVLVSYSWNLKAACGRARMSVAEVQTGLRIQVLGNPVDGQWATVDISGAAGESVQLTVFDLQGHLLHQARIEQAGAMERVRVPVGVNKGLFLLQARTATERQQVKLIIP